MNCKPNYRVLRTIHPIGQGGFTSEEHILGNESRVFVYDCGTSSNKNNAVLYVKNIFPKNTEIEALFISHFDSDHVNLIPTLQKTYRIKNVFLPIIDSVEKSLLLKLLESNLHDLIENPNVFFDDNTKIFRIDADEIASEVNANSETGEGEFELNVPANNHEVLQNGSLISLGKHWEFILFNIHSKKRYCQLQSLLKEYGITVTDKNFSHAELEKFKNLYKQLEGSINSNSMIVYSGVASKAKHSYFYHCPEFYFHRYPYVCNYAPAALYSGDYDCEQVNQLSSRLGDDRLSKIHLVQIPHHGSKNGLKQDLLAKLPNAHQWFAQYGEKNPYQHPHSQILQQIQANKPFTRIHHITEIRSTIYISEFCCFN